MYIYVYIHIHIYIYIYVCMLVLDIYIFVLDSDWGIAIWIGAYKSRIRFPAHINRITGWMGPSCFRIVAGGMGAVKTCEQYKIF